MKTVPVEPPNPITPEDVQRIFGFTKPEELIELLKKCPRHYIRSYYAQIFLGSPQNTNDIRSNNDGYLRNQIVRAIEGAGIRLGGVNKGGKKKSPQIYQQDANEPNEGRPRAPLQSPGKQAFAKMSGQKMKPMRNVIYLQADGSLSGATPAQQSATEGPDPERLIPAGRAPVSSPPVNPKAASPSTPQRRVSMENVSSEMEEQEPTRPGYAAPFQYEQLMSALMACGQNQAALQACLASLQGMPGPHQGFGFVQRPVHRRPPVVPRQPYHPRFLPRIAQPWAAPPVDFANLDPYLLADLMHAQPQLMAQAQQLAAQQQHHQGLFGQPVASTPQPHRFPGGWHEASLSPQLPPQGSEALQGTRPPGLQPQVSVEAAKLQQMGAKMGTKLRPESAQKIQDEAAAKVHSDFLRGDFEDLMQRTGSQSTPGAASPEAHGGHRPVKDDEEPMAGSRKFAGLMSTSTAVPEVHASKPIAVQPRKWQPSKGSGTQSEGAAFNRFSPDDHSSLCTTSDIVDEPEDAARERRMSHSGPVSGLQLMRRRRIAKRRRRLLSRSQDGMGHDSAFTRIQPSKGEAKLDRLEGHISKTRHLDMSGSDDDDTDASRDADAQAKTSAFAALLDAAEAMQVEEGPSAEM